ncbi:PAS domain-containing sensor histidine kinase [uncultured Clostridium sp.]|uniref:PAS domain-containing sensor histidine kinase n=1 Tax=uncultured Clostridium sp. TaxID=59620 RepID=UPI0028E3796C|nr:PAS domain-containing sensor histidine kinase [uncultured Clostridium sp.]
MNNDLLYNVRKSIIKERNDTILDVNDYFLDLTQFSKNELCGKNITEVLQTLFRGNYKINITEEEFEGVIFTKSFDVRFIKVKKYKNFNDNITLYIFNELKNSRLDNKLLFIENLINDNKIGIGIYTANDLKLIKANQKYLDYMPKPFNKKELVYGKCIHEFIDNFEKYGAKDIFLKTIKNNKSTYLTELPGLLLGHNDYWDNTITPISENGKVKFVMSMLENVTDRVLSRKHIQAKNKQLGTIIESVEDIISIVDKYGKYIKKSTIFENLFNDKNNDLEQLVKSGNYYDLHGHPISPEDLCFNKLLKGVKIKGQKLKYVSRDKEYYLSCNAIPIFDENNQFETGIIVTQDITELIKNTKLIYNQKKELEVIFENIYDGLAIIDKTGRYTKTNKAFTNVLTIDDNVLSLDRVGETLIRGQKYYNENDDELNITDLPSYKVLKGEIIKDQRIILKKKYGKTYLDFNGVPIFDENKNFQCGIILSHDISHIIKNNIRLKEEQLLILKAEHEKLEEAEKTIAMKDEFITLISHEFKTPLNVIFSAIQLIESAYINDIPDKVKGLIKNIKQNTFRQLRLVNNLLDITRLNSGQFKLHIQNIDIVSLTKQISHSVKLYSNQKNIKLLFKCSLLYREIAIDDEKFERIMLNLLSNAIKFTDEGGTVSVSLDENIDTNSIIIEVSDTGIGIPKDKQNLIFERFGQVESNLSRPAEGTGIGLFLVKKLVDALNGKIALESEPDSGSTFRITLPANQYLDIENSEVFNGGNNTLVNALNVEFSDVYL